jgi:hypothetical protein
MQSISISTTVPLWHQDLTTAIAAWPRDRAHSGRRGWHCLARGRAVVHASVVASESSRALPAAERTVLSALLAGVLPASSDCTSSHQAVATAHHSGRCVLLDRVGAGRTADRLRRPAGAGSGRLSPAYVRVTRR